MSDMHIDHERARKQGSLVGDPLVARSRCEVAAGANGGIVLKYWSRPSGYAEGEVIDHFCLACGSTFAGHDEYSDCWRILKSDDELRRYDAAKAVCDHIECSQ